MHFNYKELWKILIDRFWKNKKLVDNYGICSSSIAKLEKDVNLTTEVLPEVYNSLPCDIVTFWELCEINFLKTRELR